MEKSFDARTVVLLLFVVFAVGCLGGTLVIQNQLSQQINQNNQLISNLNQTINTINDNQYVFSKRVNDLESDYITLNGIVQTTDNYIITLNEEMEYLDYRLDLLDSDLRKVIQHNNEYIEKISDLEEHIDNLYIELGVDPDNRLYLDNNLMFEYPREMNISDSGLRLGDASIYSGIVIGAYLDDNVSEVFLSTWDADVLGQYASFTSIPEESALDDLRDFGFRKVTLLETDSKQIDGHTMEYWHFSGKYGQINCTGIYGGWYCPQNKRMHYLIAYEFGGDGSISFLDDLLTSFRCH